MDRNPWVNFLTAVRERKVPRYCLLDRKVEPLDPSDEEEESEGMNPWLIVILILVALYGFYYYNKSSETHNKKMPRGHPNYLYGLPPLNSRSYARTRKKTVRSVTYNKEPAATG